MGDFAENSRRLAASIPQTLRSTDLLSLLKGHACARPPTPASAPTLGGISGDDRWAPPPPMRRHSGDLHGLHQQMAEPDQDWAAQMRQLIAELETPSPSARATALAPPQLERVQQPTPAPTKPSVFLHTQTHQRFSNTPPVMGTSSEQALASAWQTLAREFSGGSRAANSQDFRELVMMIVSVDNLAAALRSVLDQSPELLEVIMLRICQVRKTQRQQKEPHPRSVVGSFRNDPNAPSPSDEAYVSSPLGRPEASKWRDDTSRGPLGDAFSQLFSGVYS